VAVEHGLTETRNTSLNSIFVYNLEVKKVGALSVGTDKNLKGCGLGNVGLYL
jgi:hypothetical protein